MSNMTDPQQQLYVPAKQQNTLYPVRDLWKLFGHKLTIFRSLLTVIRTYFRVPMLHLSNRRLAISGELSSMRDQKTM